MCLSRLTIGFLILFIYNLAQPIIFRYGTIKCSADLITTRSCGNNYISYDYELKYKDIRGYYNSNCSNNDNCKLFSELYCDIMQPKYGESYLSIVTDNSITPSNVLNALIFFVGFIFCLMFLIRNTVSYMKETTQII